MNKKRELHSILDELPLSAFHYQIALLCFLFTLVNGYAVVTLSLIVPLLAESWDLPSSNFAPAHFAVMVGVLVGSILAGTLSDKYGRKKTILLMTLISVLGMGLSVFANAINALCVYRLLTGIGAGAIPVAIALVSEYIPKKHRNLLVVIVFAGPPFSGVVAGYIGPYLTQLYGWEAIFYLGLILAISAIIIGLFALPESIKFLQISGKHSQKINALLHKLLPKGQAIAIPDTHTPSSSLTGSTSLNSLFESNRSGITLILWALFFSTQFVMFFLNLWVPTILVNEGWTLENGGRALANFNLGSFFGGFLIGRAADKYGVKNMLKAIFPISALSLFILGFCISNPMLYFIVAFFAGGATLGANMGLGPLSASLYPVRMRGTGIGTALGVGRLGAMAAAMFGGYLIAKGVGGTIYYHMAVIPPIFCLGCMFLLTNIIEKRSGKVVPIGPHK